MELNTDRDEIPQLVRQFSDHVVRITVIHVAKCQLIIVVSYGNYHAIIKILTEGKTS